MDDFERASYAFPDLSDNISSNPNSNSNHIDFDLAASAFPDINGIGDDAQIPLSTPAPVSAADQRNNVGMDDFDFGEEVAVGNGGMNGGGEVKITGDDELDRFESEFPDIGGQEDLFSAPSQPSFLSPQQQGSYGSQPASHQASFGVNGNDASFAAPTYILPTEEEPEVMKEWRARQQTQIAEREAAAAQKRADTIAKAERDIDSFYEEYARSKENTIRQNKESEAELLASLSDTLSNGTTWSRICDLVDLQNSQSKTVARAGAGTTDLARYREVLLGLRKEGENAPGAGGY